MTVLLDTNILTRLAQQTHVQHAIVRQAIVILQRQESLCIVPQNLYEFWTVATRPIGGTNGLGLSSEQANVEIARAKTLFTFMPDSPAVYWEWEQLVIRYDVKGKAAHDARLVAAMTVHGVKKILTFNDSDFFRYSTVTVMTPQRVIELSAAPTKS